MCGQKFAHVLTFMIGTFIIYKQIIQYSGCNKSLKKEPPVRIYGIKNVSLKTLYYYHPLLDS